ncbi:hypothetical protein [Peribacillus simplex]|uniref:hypothetical protein n=1 Tax=Peribacillus simplex TaxID=1478 RepID=UPI003D291558
MSFMLLLVSFEQILVSFMLLLVNFEQILVSFMLLLLSLSITREFHAFTREFRANTREFHAFTREFHAFTREFRANTREFHAFTREFHALGEMVWVKSGPCHALCGRCFGAYTKRKPHYLKRGFNIRSLRCGMISFENYFESH